MSRKLFLTTQKCLRRPGHGERGGMTQEGGFSSVIPRVSTYIGVLTSALQRGSLLYDMHRFLMCLKYPLPVGYALPLVGVWILTIQQPDYCDRCGGKRVRS